MRIYQVDAFTDKIFGGNPAAVCPLTEWLPDREMQQIAMENNLSETAFIKKESDGYMIRWFAPEMEIDLCGHATLAAAHVLFNHLNFGEELVSFTYAKGKLAVTKENDKLSMDFPAMKYKKVEASNLLKRALGKEPMEVYQARDIMAVFDNEKEVAEVLPDFSKLKELEALGLIVTARGENVDFVSRFFAPRAGICEDPVTGSAHCMLIPYWAGKLGKDQLHAVQLSKRRGELFCEHKGERVNIAGRAVTYMTGEISI